MKNLFICFLLLVSFSNIYSQQWYLDFHIAKKIASQQNRKIVMVFQGSDWCSTCRKLERNVWDSDEFKNYAREKFVLLKVDFPRKKINQLTTEQILKNKSLAAEYNVDRLFPKVLVLDKTGRILGVAGYEKLTPQEYVDMLSEF